MERDSRARHDAVVVEIVYAVVSSLVLAGAVIGAAALAVAPLDLEGQGWEWAGAAGAAVVLALAGVRVVALLVSARRHGL
jgi:hypothetical protein